MNAKSSTRRAGAIRVLIVDDHAVVREGIRHVLETDDGFLVVGEAGTGTEAIQQSARLAPDVVVLDLTMPGMSGLEAAPRIREAAPAAKLLVLSMHDHEEYVQQSLRAGAAGYMRKDSPPAELRAGIRAVHAGERFFNVSIQPERSDASQAETRLASLTSRERDVLLEIARGASNKQIAGRFGISVRTVESHRESLARKLQLKGAASLTRFAIENGLLASD